MAAVSSGTGCLLDPRPDSLDFARGLSGMKRRMPRNLPYLPTLWGKHTRESVLFVVDGYYIPTVVVVDGDNWQPPSWLFHCLSTLWGISAAEFWLIRDFISWYIWFVEPSREFDKKLNSAFVNHLLIFLAKNSS